MSHSRLKLSQVATIANITFFCLTAFFFTAAVTFAQVIPGDPANFITTWDTEIAGESNDNQILFPGSGIDYHIYWEDTASSSINGTSTVSGATTITFPEPGIYRIEVSGPLTRIRFNDSGDKDKILQVNQWGSINWSSMHTAFFGASNLRIPATDQPNLSSATRMDSMFRDATSFNDPINHWNVSNIENMTGIFLNAYAFNQPLNDWDVSNVNNMRTMFRGAISFNQPLNEWITTNVTNMGAMFRGYIENDTPAENYAFNQDIGMWDVGNVNYMRQMFNNATDFNQDISGWDTSNVTSMESMFSGAPAFNQDLGNWVISSISYDAEDPCGEQDGMCNMFFDVSLSQENIDSTLSSWAQQAVDGNITNIPFHVGLKTYSSIGSVAISDLQNLGWVISEQYQATYSPGTRSTLLGSGEQQFINNGSSTESVTIVPDDRCEFIQWSDNNTQNPRTDILADNISVSAQVSCKSSSGSTITSRISNLEAMGKLSEAEALRKQYSPTYSNKDTTIEDSIETVRVYLTDPVPFDESDQAKVRELIDLLLELVAALTQLLLLTTLKEVE